MFSFDILHIFCGVKYLERTPFLYIMRHINASAFSLSPKLSEQDPNCRSGWKYTKKALTNLLHSYIDISHQLKKLKGKDPNSHIISQDGF